MNINDIVAQVRMTLNNFQEFKSLKTLVNENKCMPYSFQDRDGNLYCVIDFQRTMTNNPKIYRQRIQQSIKEMTDFYK